MKYAKLHLSMFHINSNTCLSKRSHVQCPLVCSLSSASVVQLMHYVVQSECSVVHSKHSVFCSLSLVSAEIPKKIMKPCLTLIIIFGQRNNLNSILTNIAGCVLLISALKLCDTLGILACFTIVYWLLSCLHYYH